MSKQSSDDTFLHHEISIRNEYTRFACMFYFFTLLALLTTIFLFILINNSYYHELETIQRRFIPYSILGLISLILFFVFFLGSIVYTSKLIRKFRSKSIPTEKLKSLILTHSTSTVMEEKSRTTPCQTDL